MKYILEIKDLAWKPRCPFYRENEKKENVCFVKPKNPLGFMQPCNGLCQPDCPLGREDVIISYGGKK